MNIKKSMETLVKDYDADMELASRDLAGWDYRTRNSAEMGKNQAQTRLPQTIEKYSQILNQSTICFLVYGSNDEYAAFQKQLDVITKGATYFTDNTLSLYEFLSPRVEQNMGTNREFNVHSLMMLVAEMAILGKELKKNSILEPKLSVVKTTPTHESVVLTIRDTIMVNSNYNFMLEYIQYVFTKNALAAKHSSNSTIFVLRCLDKLEADDLSTSKSVPVDLSSTEDYTKLIKDVLKTNKGA